MVLDSSSSDVSTTNCIVQNNRATYGSGGGVVLDSSSSDVSITNCIVQNNRATYGGGGGVVLHNLTAQQHFSEQQCCF